MYARYQTEPNLSKFNFYFRTWSGLILIVNTIVFIICAVKSGTLLEIPPEILVQLGAQDPVSLSQGEYWRYVTPMFLHGGLIHYLFNSMAIYYLGRDLEPLLGSRWFLFVYFISGLAGSVCSEVFSSGLSVGASGALFGLIGAGLYFELRIARYLKATTGQRPRRGPYLSMLMLNLVITFLIPVIDKFAHIGGLVTGAALTFAFVRISPNRLVTTDKPRAYFALAFTLITIITMGIKGVDKGYLAHNLLNKARGSSSTQAIFYYSRAIEIDPLLLEAYFERGKIFFEHQYYDDAFADFEHANLGQRFQRELSGLADELDAQGRPEEALRLRSLIKKHETI